MKALRSSSTEQTQALAAAVSSLVRTGDLILLVGDLGTGKTTFTQGFARALGVHEPVTSPTFTLVHTYAGTMPIHHVDVYRLERMGEVNDLDLGELLDDGVTLIEWGDAVMPVLPADYLEIRFAYLDESAGDDCGQDSDMGTDEREISFHAVGLGWRERSAVLGAVTDGWSASC